MVVTVFRLCVLPAASGQERQHAKQIFTSSAASGILTNDLVKIMECAKVFGKWIVDTQFTDAIR